tara:strand:- start:94 stop:2979 length:2886 start_codon:yes stop_codon:yes gene_type:complete
METLQYQIKGSDHGISSGDFFIDLPAVLDGIPLYDGNGQSNYPRNATEKTQFDMLISQFQKVESQQQANTTADASNTALTVEEQQALSVEQYDAARIKDPIKADLNVAEAIAERQSFGYAKDIGKQIGNIVPFFGGPVTDFSPNALAESYKNFFLSRAPNDPKTMLGDVSVIASDLIMAGISMGNFKFKNPKNFNIPLFTNESRRQGLYGYMENNPVKATMAVNMMARGTSDMVYDTLNKTYGWLQGVEADQSDDGAVENIVNLRNELLFSGGAAGLAKLFPYIKPFIGRSFLGINDEARRLATLGRTHNVPMSVFNVTNSGLVAGLPPVVGLFPIVATNARLAQNAQQAAVYTSILKSLDDFSPIVNFNDAGIMVDAGFRKMVSEYGLMKGVLYNNVSKQADKLNGEAFIPTDKIKILAGALRQRLKEGQISVETRSIGSGGDYSQTQSFEEVFQKISGAGGEIESALMQLDGLPDHLNAQQFKRMIEVFNATKREVPNLKLTENSDEALMLNDFHTQAIQAMNAPESWLKMEGAQKELAEEWSKSYAIANDFVFQNSDSLKGKTAMLLKQTDPNISIPGAVKQPGYLFADQMAKIFFDDQTIASPMALKEMRKAFGDDAFNASTRAYFDDILRKNTEFVSGKLKVYNNQISIWQKGKAFVTGKEPIQATQTINYNIPIMDLNKMADAFSVDNINRRGGIIEMYKAAGTGSEAARTKYANEMVDKMSNVIELAKAVQMPNYGDVSSFVKRRGTLGGLGSIANFITGGAVLADPISSAGVMLMARFSMNGLSDPRFLDSLTTVLSPGLDDVARKSALVTIGRAIFDPERAVEEGYDINDIGDIIELIVSGDMEQSAAYNTRAADEDAEMSAVPEAIRGERTYTANQQTAGMNFPDGYLNNQSSAADLEALIGSQDMSQAPVNTGFSGGQLNQDQKIAMAGGNLDEAIALGSRNTGLGSLRV